MTLPSGVFSLEPMIAKLQEAAQATRLGPELIALALLVLVSLMVAAFALRRRGGNADAPVISPARIIPVALGFVFLTGIAGWFLIHRLDDYSGADSVLVWEAPIAGRHLEIINEGKSTAQVFFDCLKWDDGLVARGEAMMLYGPPTHAAFLALGYTTVALRIVSVFWALASLQLMYLLGRRFSGGSAVAGLAAAAYLSLDQIFLFVGHYGTGLSASLFATLLAVNIVWWFLEHPRPPWWSGLACAAALFLATLHYSPARIVVLLLLGLITWCLVIEFRQLGARHRIAFAVILLCGALVVAAEYRAGTARLFLAARGEQAAYFVDDPHYIRKILKRADSESPLTSREKLELAGRVAATNLPALARHFTPSWRLTQEPGAATIGTDPPRVPVLRAALLPLVWLGLLLGWWSAFTIGSTVVPPNRSRWIVRWTVWRQGFLVAWVVGTAVTLLFTTRVDSYRLHLLIIPFAVWAGLGVAAFREWLLRAGCPRWIGSGLAATTVLLLAWQNIWWEFTPEIRAAGKGGYVAERSLQLPKSEPLNLISSLTVGERGWVQLAIEEANRRKLGPPLAAISGPPHELLADGILQGPPENVDDAHLDQIETFEESLAGKQTLVGPGQSLLPLVDYLKRRGFIIRELTLPPGMTEFLRADWTIHLIPVQPTPARARILPPEDASAPRSDPDRVAAGKTIPLTDQSPLRSIFGFSPTQFDKSSQGQPIRMGGVDHPRGIGMHTPSTITYAVPAEAEFFEAVIGFDDEIRQSKVADATFRVRDKDGRLLFSSGRLVPADGPKGIRVPVRDAGEITLSVSEARNGRDEDHVNWGSAQFIVAP